MMNDSILLRLKDQVCVCFTEAQLTIGIVDYAEDSYNVLILKDARLIIPNEENPQDKLTLGTIIQACSSIDTFKQFCRSMSPPIEYLVIKNPYHTLVVSKDIKQFYKEATNVDKTIIKENNSGNPSVRKKFNSELRNPLSRPYSEPLF